MMFFLLVGNRYRTTSEGTTPEVRTCPSCGARAQFDRKRRRQYLTLFFLLPVLPLGSAQEFVECPNCHTQFQATDPLSRAA